MSKENTAMSITEKQIEEQAGEQPKTDHDTEAGVTGQQSTDENKND